MNATTAGIPVVLGPEGSENGLSLWKVKARIQTSDVNGEAKEQFNKEWNIVAIGHVSAVPKVYSKFQGPSSDGRGRVIVTKVEILGIEWLGSVDITE